MPRDEEGRKSELERRLEKAPAEAAHYRGIAAESGRSRLRNMFLLSGLAARHRDVEQRLRESEERHRSVVENLNVGMLVTVDLKIGSTAAPDDTSVFLNHYFRSAHTA